jgi:amidohydrolase
VDLPAVKERLRAEVEARAEALLAASHEIHAHPELNYEERFAHDLLTDLLADEGLAVERKAYGLDTAFVARAGASGPTIAVLCEYDALPGIGHACGHNIIATAGLGAGLAAAAVAEEVGGRVVVMGTPAEEGGGGKILLAQRGAFGGVDAALMVHPASWDLTRMDVIAVQELTAVYTGEAAHAAAFPHRGRNALDAAVLGYVNVAALRQHIATSDRVHGIFTDGGAKTNIVPERAEMDWMVRTARVEDLDALVARVHACLGAGAAAAGCTWEHRVTMRTYADMVDSTVLLDRFAAHAEALGRPLADPRITGTPVTGSTDMGNVSHLVPSIHPVLAVSPPDVSIHSAAFTGHAGGPAGDTAALDGARAMAATVVDVWSDPSLLEQARAALDDRTAA